jgi:hypothetical protein
MIDEMIPDLQNRTLRRLYDALRGRREATLGEKMVLVAVVKDIEDAGVRGDYDCTLPQPELARKVALVMQRALQVDKETFGRRLNEYIDDVLREFSDDEAAQ